MGNIVIAYTDGKKHKHDMFRYRADRDECIKFLRVEGWTVKAGSTTVEGTKWYYYDAEKER